METILYVCVHNAGRSQIAEAFTRQIAQQRGLQVDAASAGTIVGEQINPVAIQVMLEVGISLAGHSPKQITPDMVRKAHRIIGMGCGVDAAACPTKFLLAEDWGLDDPAGQPIETVRRIRDEIKLRVEQLLCGMANDR